MSYDQLDLAKLCTFFLSCFTKLFVGVRFLRTTVDCGTEFFSFAGWCVQKTSVTTEAACVYSTCSDVSLTHLSSLACSSSATVVDTNVNCFSHVVMDRKSAV